MPRVIIDQPKNGRTIPSDEFRDWKSELRLIQSGLESLARHTQRDHYHHTVLSSNGPLPEIHWRLPHVYASGHRVTQRIDVPLSDGQHLTHIVFDHNLDLEDDGVLKGLRQELGRVRSVLRTIPRRLVPEFELPAFDHGADGQLVAWFSFLHWLAHRRPNRVFKAHLEFLPAKGRIDAGDPFIPWDDLPTAHVLDPVPVLTFTGVESEPLATAPDGMVASSLSKPLLYASVNAIDLILRAGHDETPLRSARRPATEGGLDPLSQQLLLLLYGHHKQPDGSVCEEPLDEHTIADKLGCSQPTVSRRMGILFGDGRPGTRPMTRYRQLCRNRHRIDSELTRLWFRHMEKRLSRELNCEDMNQFADRDECEDA